MDDPAFVAWLNELADVMGGFYDETDNNLLVDPGDGVGANSYAYSELVSFYNNRFSPKEVADILRNGVGV